LWQGKKRNLRGDILEAWILERGLTVENIGGNATWRNYKTSTHIDLTLTTPELEDSVSNWRAEFRTSSDHATVSFEVKGKKSKSIDQVLKYTDWELAEYKFKRIIWVPKYTWKTKTVDREMADLEKVINNTILASTHTRRVRKKIGAARIEDERIDESRALGDILMGSETFTEEMRKEIYQHLDKHKKLIKLIKSERYFEFLDGLVDPKRLLSLTRRAIPAANKVISLVGSTPTRPAC
jgi:hypothetical protein